MQGHVWSIEEQVYPKADPLMVAPGDRVRFRMHNRTGMWHPMHLYGHYFRPSSAAPAEFRPRKHTLSVPPKGSAELEFVADNPGTWFYHCHNLYHLEAGMARELVYRIG